MFYIQGWQYERVVSVIVEKVQIQSLAVGVEQFIEEVRQQYPDLPESSAEFDETKMRIQPPVDPLFRAGEGTVVGVVASKHAPMSPFVSSAIEALSSNPRGSAYLARNAKGEQRKYVESQLVAEVLTYLHGLAQVMIGQAVCASEVRRFLRNVDRRERGRPAAGGPASPRSAGLSARRARSAAR